MSGGELSLARLVITPSIETHTVDHYGSGHAVRKIGRANRFAIAVRADAGNSRSDNGTCASITSAVATTDLNTDLRIGVGG